MTRTMGDAVHAEVGLLPGGLDAYAGYDTGSPDIRWTDADWSRFPGATHIHIDQGFTGSPVFTADVRDVEAGAWTPGAAVLLNGWTAPRPTIYCNRSTLPLILGGGWRGDLWLAIPGWLVGDPLPPAPGCTIVAVQNQFDVGTHYDLSVILDPTWPEVATMPQPQLQPDVLLCKDCGAFYYGPGSTQVCPGNGGGKHADAGFANFSVIYAQ